MWTTWLERILGQRPANENEPPAAQPAETVTPGVVPGISVLAAETPVDDAAETEPADEVMP